MPYAPTILNTMHLYFNDFIFQQFVYLPLKYTSREL
jgi:hypothetical protein